MHSRSIKYFVIKPDYSNKQLNRLQQSHSINSRDFMLCIYINGYDYFNYTQHFSSSIFNDSIHILNLCFSPIKTVLIAQENSPSPFEDLLNLKYCLAYSEHKKIH